jgi:hypothetical protein
MLDCGLPMVCHATCVAPKEAEPRRTPVVRKVPGPSGGATRVVAEVRPGFSWRRPGLKVGPLAGNDTRSRGAAPGKPGRLCDERRHAKPYRPQSFLELQVMLTKNEEAEQIRINKAHAFSLRLAHMTQPDVERLARRDQQYLHDLRPALNNLANRSGRERRCEQALQFARGGLIDGCDLAMQHIAGAGPNDTFGWGVAANPWMALQPAVEVQALAFALDDLLTPAQRAAARVGIEPTSPDH